MDVSSEPPGPAQAGERSAPPPPPRHRATPRTRRVRRRRAVAAVLAMVVVAGAVVAGLGVAYHLVTEGTTTTLTPAQQAEARAQAHEQKEVSAAASLVGVPLPSRPGAPAPALPAAGVRHPLPTHQVWGYVPYWYMGSVTAGAELASFTTVAYFALGIHGDGSLVETDSGWGDLGSAPFTSLMSKAHGAGDRVLLTVATDDQTVLASIAAAPSPAAHQLLPALLGLVRRYGFDGVDLDLEGHDASWEAGFTTFAEAVADGVHAANPAYQVAIDTYPQSAGESSGFFDIPALAPHVDTFFVMAYDLSEPGSPSANAPLMGTSVSVASALEEYTAIVPRSKIVLGVPFYGDDWVTGKVGAPASPTGPVSLTYAQIVARPHAVHFDPATDTVFIDYAYQGRWHETWFDDPLTLALKSALASEYHVAGVGAWALGMQGTAPDMVSALLGGSGPVKLPLVRAGA